MVLDFPCKLSQQYKSLGQMKQPLSWLLLAALNLLLPIGILMFAKGFFPYKPFLPGLAIFDNETDQRIAQTAPFDKVILMVVDALRRYRTSVGAIYRDLC